MTAPILPTEATPTSNLGTYPPPESTLNEWPTQAIMMATAKIALKTNIQQEIQRHTSTRLPIKCCHCYGMRAL
jgi:hypothetical protein